MPPESSERVVPLVQMSVFGDRFIDPPPMVTRAYSKYIPRLVCSSRKISCSSSLDIPGWARLKAVCIDSMIFTEASLT